MVETKETIRETLRRLLEDDLSDVEVTRESRLLDQAILALEAAQKNTTLGTLMEARDAIEHAREIAASNASILQDALECMNSIPGVAD